MVRDDHRFQAWGPPERLEQPVDRNRPWSLKHMAESA
ncbi:6,7-dimethyl-8-ribityllumazine synthase, partial [Xanthomonas oryzae pv. oryzae]